MRKKTTVNQSAASPAGKSKSNSERSVKSYRATRTTKAVRGICWRALIAAAILISTTFASAQNFTTVTATKIQYVSGQLLPKGSLCFQGTDNNNNPISFQAGGGGQVVTAAICVGVTSGTSAALQVPNPQNTTPANVLYRITVVANNTTLYQCNGAQLSGASFNFDTYACATGTLPSPGGVVNGPLTVNGNLTVASCTGCGTSSAGYVRYYPTTPPNGTLTSFTFMGQASSNTKFQLTWNGLMMNEGDDYTISIGSGTTTVTLIRPPGATEHIIAYF